MSMAHWWSDTDMSVSLHQCAMLIRSFITATM